MAEEEASLTIMATEKPSGYPEFDAPPGFTPPEGIEPEKPFPALVELQVKPDGKLCLVSIEGSAYPEEEYEEEDEEMEMEMEEEEMSMPMQDERAFSERLASLPMS
jgi:hypothetical protein